MSYEPTEYERGFDDAMIVTLELLESGYNEEQLADSIRQALTFVGHPEAVDL